METRSSGMVTSVTTSSSGRNGLKETSDCLFFRPSCSMKMNPLKYPSPLFHQNGLTNADVEKLADSFEHLREERRFLIGLGFRFLFRFLFRYLFRQRFIFRRFAVSEKQTKQNMNKKKTKPTQTKQDKTKRNKMKTYFIKCYIATLVQHNRIRTFSRQ